MASADKEQLGVELSAYLDGELSPQRAREIERILEQSEEARRLHAELRSISESLRALPRLSAPVDFARRTARSSERQALLERPHPRSEVVLKLALRISASAAVIFACVFAGWTVFSRPAMEPGATGRAADLAASTKSEGASRVAQRAAGNPPPAHADEPAPMIAFAPPKAGRDVTRPVESEVRTLEALGYLSKGDRGPADALVLANTSREAPAAGERYPRTAVNESETGTPGAPLAPIDAPLVAITITPQSDDEYVASLDALARWQAVSQGQGLVRRSGQAGRANDKKESAETERLSDVSSVASRSVLLDLSAAHMQALLVDLDAQAPEQVQIAMTFRPDNVPQVQQMLAAGGPPRRTAFAPEPGAPLRRTAPEPLGGGRMAPLSGARGRAALETPLGKDADEQTVVRDSATPVQSGHERGYAFAIRQPPSAADTRGRETSPARQESDEYDALRQPRVEDVAVGLPVRSDETRAAGHGNENPLIALRDTIVRSVGTQVEHVLGTLGNVLRPESATRKTALGEEPPSQMRLRITILPPATLERPPANH